MKIIREKFTIVERLMFLLIIVIIAIILIPIICDRIEEPKRKNAIKDAKTYVEIVNQYLSEIKETEEEIFNEIIKYNSVSKYCSFNNEDLMCGDIKLEVLNKDIIVGQESIIYFSKEGVVEGYKIIVDGYKVIYPDSKGLLSIKKYKEHNQKSKEK